MRHKPKFSIITVCLNAPNLRQTCDSIVNQTYQDFEWLVIDGGSNQETLDIFEQYRNRIDFFVSEKDNGIYNAMNKGIANATGEYLLFLNAGDSFYSADVLDQFVNAGLDADIIYANMQYDNTKSVFVPADILDAKFWVKYSLPHQATLIKRELFNLYGPYNEKNKVVSDYEKWLEFIYVNHCTYKHVNFTGCVFDCTGLSSNSNYDKELTTAMCKYMTPSEIKTAINQNLSLLQKIFSVMPWLLDKSYLDICVFGIHIYIKRKK